MQTILVKERSNPATLSEWSGVGGIPEVQPPKVATAASAIVSVDTSATVLADNPNRRRFMLQNVSMSPVYVKLGTGCSAADYSFVLQAGTADADGKGGTYLDDGYTGPVSALAASGTNRKLAVTEL